MGHYRTRPPLKTPLIELAQGEAIGLLPKGSRASDSRQARSNHAKGLTGPTRRRIPPHLEADVSQSDRDALIGLPFS